MNSSVENINTNSGGIEGFLHLCINTFDLENTFDRLMKKIQMSQ